MNRLLITVLLALAIAVSLMSLAKAQSTGAKTPAPSSSTQNSDMPPASTESNSTMSMTPEQKATARERMRHNRLLKDQSAPAATVMSTSSGNDSTVPMGMASGPNNSVSQNNAKAPMTQLTNGQTQTFAMSDSASNCDDQHNCEQVEGMVNGQDITVTAKLLKSDNGDYVANVTSSVCKECELNDPTTISVNNSSFKDIKAVLDRAAGRVFGWIKAGLGIDSTDDKRTAEKKAKDEEALEKSKDAAEMDLKLCKGSEVVLDGKKYKVKGKLKPQEKIDCLIKSYEDSSDSDDDTVTAKIFQGLTDACLQAYKNTTKKNEDLRDSCESFVENHSSVGDNAGLLMNFEIQNALYQPFDLGGTITQIQALISSGNLQAATQAIQALSLRARSPIYNQPIYTQAAQTARTNALGAMQKYYASLGGTLPDDGILNQMASLSNSNAANIGQAGLASQINILTAQLNQKAVQEQTAQNLTNSALNNTSYSVAKSLVNSALLSTPGALSFLARGGEVPRDYNSLGDGAAAGVGSWRESAYHEYLGCSQGRLSSAALSLQNGLISATSTTPLCNNLGTNSALTNLNTGGLNTTGLLNTSNGLLPTSSNGLLNSGSIPTINVLTSPRGSGRG